MRSFRFVTASLLLALSSLFAASGCDDVDPISEFTPEVTLSETILDFGALPIGSRVARQLTLTNSGTGPLVFSSQRIEAPFSFELDQSNLGARDSRVVEVFFSPQNEGEARSQFELVFGEPVGEREIALVGVGLPNPLEVSPSLLDFGEVSIGEERTLSVALENTGSAAQEIAIAIEGGGFLLESGETTLTIAPGEVVERAITFAPLEGGQRDAEFFVQSCGEGCGIVVALKGVGQASRIVASPLSIDFGTLAPNEEGVRELTITNEGFTALIISEMSVGIDTLTLEHETLPIAIAPNEEAPVTLRFSSPTPLALVEALSISSNDPLAPRVQIPLSGEIDGPALSAIPGAIEFGRLLENESRTQTLVLQSVGTVDVVVDAMTLAGASFSFTGDEPRLPMTLAPRESVLFSVQATQTLSEQTRTFGSIDIESNAQNVSVPLAFDTPSGGCVPSALSTNVNIGFVSIGESGRGTIAVENRGDASCVLVAAREVTELGFDAAFGFATSGFPIAPNQLGEINFTFDADDVGPQSAFVELEFENGDTTLVSASAFGVLGSLVVEPSVVEFGPFSVGCPSQTRVVNLVNRSSVDVEINSLVAEDASTFTMTPAQVSGTVRAGGAISVEISANFDTLGIVESNLSADTEELGVINGRLRVDTVEQATPVVESFETPPERAVDILFVVDNSGSMGDDQERLAQNFERFLEVAQDNPNADFHIGVTSTDVLSDRALDGRLAGTPNVLTRSTASLAQRFRNNVLLGTDGAGIEIGLEAMLLALSSPQINNANSGFLRDDAALSIVVVSDEDDSGAVAQIQDIYPRGTRSVEGYATFLENLKSTQENTPIIFSSVGIGGARYQAMVNRFSGISLNITDPAWGEDLGQLAAASFSIVNRFVLDSQPRAGSVSVRVNGEEVVDFTVDQGTVELDVSPPAESSVEITYVPEC